MKINTRAVKEAGELLIRESISSQQVDPNPPFGVAYHHPFQCEIKASVVDDQILIRGEVKGEATLACSRCLDEFSQVLNANFEMMAGVQQGDVELSDEVSQAIVLVLPMKPLCQERCRGLCAQCGQNLNTRLCPCKPEMAHPALESLKKLKFQPTK